MNAKAGGAPVGDKEMEMFASQAALATSPYIIGNIGWPGLLIILLAVVILFGRGKISQVMGDVAKGINAFKKGMKEGADDEAKAIKDGETIDVASENRSQQHR